MRRIRPYVPIVNALVLELGRLGLCVVRQLIPPGRRRPGNLLSSLFLLFTGVAEQAICFRQAVVRIPCNFSDRFTQFMQRGRVTAAWAYSKRALRFGTLFAAWALFILSSLEWKGGESPKEGKEV